MLHVLEGSAWITVEPDFNKSRVIVSSLLLDLEPTSDLAGAVARLNGADTPFKFAVAASGRLTATVEVAAHPFVPLHLGQALLDLIEFTFEFMDSELRVDLQGRAACARLSESGLFLQWCGTGQIVFQQQYASVDAYPAWQIEDEYWMENE